MSLHMHAHAYTHVYAHVSIHVHTHVYLHVYAHVYACVYPEMMTAVALRREGHGAPPAQRHVSSVDMCLDI